MSGFIKFTRPFLLDPPFQITEIIKDFFVFLFSFFFSERVKRAKKVSITNWRKIRVLNFILEKNFGKGARLLVEEVEGIFFVIFKENSQRFNIISLFL